MEAIDKKYSAITNAELSGNYATERLENSYAGILGKKIEPLIRPLGFDWKIGISLITSFAAREVFVSTMATIYNAGQDNLLSTQQRMKEEKNNKGEVVYSTAVCASLLIFYLFAMQCISTLAIVRRETGSWKWPAIQFFYMTGLAYLASFAVYQLLK
jgi:ferrous iron transport protein B